MPGAVHVVLFQMSGTVGFKKPRKGVEEDVLEVNSLILFRNKDLYKLLECCRQINSITFLEDPDSRV